MKSKSSLFWFFISLALAAVVVVQWNQVRQKTLMLESLQMQVEALSAHSRNAARMAEARASQPLPPASTVEPPPLEPIEPGAPPQVAAQTPAAPAPAPAAEAAQKGNMMSMLGNMMKDPEMRKAMAQQQKFGLNMAYGALFKELKLTPEQEEKFKDILLEQQMAGISRATELMQAGDNRDEVVKQLAADQKAREEKMKELLGDEGFTQYQDYNQTLGERMMLDQFGKDIQTTPEQREQLLAIMREEKKNVQINTGQDFTKIENAQAAIGSPEMAQRLFDQQQRVNTRVLERAGEVLTPEQVQKLEPVLKSQLDMQRAGMKMAREMFGGAKEQAPEAK